MISTCVLICGQVAFFKVTSGSPWSNQVTFMSVYLNPGYQEQFDALAMSFGRVTVLGPLGSVDTTGGWHALRAHS